MHFSLRSNESSLTCLAQTPGLVVAVSCVPAWSSHCHLVSGMWPLLTQIKPHWSLGTRWVSAPPLPGLHAMSLINFSGKGSILCQEPAFFIITCFDNGTRLFLPSSLLLVKAFYDCALLCFGLALEGTAPNFAGDVIPLLPRSSWSAAELLVAQVSSWKLSLSGRTHTKPRGSLSLTLFSVSPGYGGARISTHCPDMGFGPSCLPPKLNISWIPSSNLAAVWIYEPFTELPRLLLNVRAF